MNISSLSKSASLATDFLVVIRSSGERTQETCQQILSPFFPENSITVINEQPFEEAIRKCYRKGINSDKRWLITIDADILPSMKGVRKLIECASSMNDKTIMYNGVVYDKFLMKYRRGGIKVYGTDLLSEAINYIPANGTEVRPEAHTLSKMAEKGFEKVYTNNITGLHDFEQFYRDIYRKAFLHVIKHEKEVILLLKKWKIASVNDTDYQMAILGAIDGLLFEFNHLTDINTYQTHAEKAINRLGLNEKEPLKTDNMSVIVEDILNNIGPYHRETIRSVVKSGYKNQNLGSFIRWLTGSTVVRLGKIIRG